MHAEHQLFLDALLAKRCITVSYYSRKEGKNVVRKCAPLDYGPLRGAIEPEAHYQLWNLEGKKKPLNVALRASEIFTMTATDERFDPATIITWNFKPNAWSIERDWEEFS